MYLKELMAQKDGGQLAGEGAAAGAAELEEGGLEESGEGDGGLLAAAARAGLLLSPKGGVMV